MLFLYTEWQVFVILDHKSLVPIPVNEVPGDHEVLQSDSCEILGGYRFVRMQNSH